MSAATEADQTILVREFDAALSEGDGRTIDARIVPFNVPAFVLDPPDPVPYRESFLPGAFERQAAAASRVGVWLNFEHEQGLRGIVGHGVSLEERSDALYGSFRVHEGPDGEKALGLVREGLLSGLSMEFAALRSRKNPSTGIVERMRAHISRVSLCRFPAYDDARILALREEPIVDEGSTFAERLRAERTTMAPDLADRLEAIGLERLHRIATTSGSWDGSPSRFTDEEYERSTLFCRPGDGSVKERCSLPVLEPSGAVNTNALGAAAAALAGARGGLRGVSASQKATAARKLVRYYNAAGMEPPPSLRALAGSG